MSVGFEVEVVRSKKRRRTISAHMVDGKMRLLIPASLTKAEEEHWVTVMRRRFERKRHSGQVDLTKRAADLGRRYGLPSPTSIKWVDNQTQRWGSCTPDDGTIRISSAVAEFPKWVLDSVIVHELAHLVEPSHGPGFWLLAGRYPMMERARGFLIAKGGEPD